VTRGGAQDQLAQALGVSSVERFAGWVEMVFTNDGAQRADAQFIQRRRQTRLAQPRAQCEGVRDARTKVWSRALDHARAKWAR